MKFYVPNSKTFHVNEEDVKWLQPATLDYHKTKIIVHQWPDGYLFETDEYFQTFFSIKTGYTLPNISDQEYTQFVLDGVAYLDKSKIMNILAALASLELREFSR